MKRRLRVPIRYPLLEGRSSRSRSPNILHTSIPSPLGRRRRDARDGLAVRALRSGVSRGGRLSTLVPGGGTINAHRKVIVTVAVLEDTGVVVGGHVPEAAHLVVDVLAVASGVLADAGAEAELGVRHEGSPFVVLEGLAVHTEGLAEDQTTDWEGRFSKIVSTTSAN
jgi:hypothetical protein